MVLTAVAMDLSFDILLAAHGGELCMKVEEARC